MRVGLRVTTEQLSNKKGTDLTIGAFVGQTLA